MADGLSVFVKRDCPTCVAIVPALRELAAERPLHVYSQDDPGFPAGVTGVRDDRALEASWAAQVEIVPTLVRVEAGREVERLEGWHREQWRRLTGVPGLGAGLPEFRAGCGSLTMEPGMPERLAARHDGEKLVARRVELASAEDEHEALFARGWTDGLPVIPPTPERVMRMLGGTRRAPDRVVAVVPPDLAPATVEKVAINAVMAGCLPEHLPAVIAAVEAACTDEFNMHGLLATTYFSGPLVIVNGPYARAVGINSGVNALGQGTRANLAIGRALQLVVRNVGGGRPGEVDRATLGSPGKLGFCFAEDEAGSPWEPLSEFLGAPAGASAVTLFAASGLQPVVDQVSRTAESLAGSFAACLRTVAHPKLAIAWDALLVVSPEHARLFREAGWSRARLIEELGARLQVPGVEMVRGADGIAEGMPVQFRDATVPKFRPGGLLVAHAGGTAGLFSAIIGGWASGPAGSQSVTRRIEWP